MPWPEFHERSQQLYNNLDDTERIYNRPMRGVDFADSLPSAADQREVRGYVVSLLTSVNTVARKSGIPAQYTTGGSGRSMSFIDLLVRPAGAQSNPANVSGQVLGTGRVKGDWEFELKQGERLEDALHDPDRSVAIVQSIQQVRIVEQL